MSLKRQVSLSDHADPRSWPTLGTPSLVANASAPAWYIGELRRHTCVKVKIEESIMALDLFYSKSEIYKFVTLTMLLAKFSHHDSNSQV